MKIEPDIPIPQRGATLMRFMALMKIGDSFMSTDKKRQHAYDIAERLKIRVTTRKINGEGIRIWRTA